jgi:hypothetical protein
MTDQVYMPSFASHRTWQGLVTSVAHKLADELYLTDKRHRRSGPNDVKSTTTDEYRDLATCAPFMLAQLIVSMHWSCANGLL